MNSILRDGTQIDHFITEIVYETLLELEEKEGWVVLFDLAEKCHTKGKYIIEDSLMAKSKSILIKWRFINQKGEFTHPLVSKEVYDAVESEGGQSEETKEDVCRIIVNSTIKITDYNPHENRGRLGYVLVNPIHPRQLAKRRRMRSLD
ncbi:MAG: hypothetical protein P0S95_04710 [Rhabdochlamydiaceae bacterium]|nr:hypothetical protein [Candidatus Amphrikana amoebophyrae]